MDERDKLVRCTCNFCGNTFWAQRRDAKFCSNRHRTAYYRWRKRIPKFEALARTYIKALGEYLDYPNARGLAISSLSQLSTNLSDEFQSRNIKRVK